MKRQFLLPVLVLLFGLLTSSFHVVNAKVTTDSNGRKTYFVGLPCELRAGQNLTTINANRSHAHSENYTQYYKYDLQQNDECANTKVVASISGTVYRHDSTNPLYKTQVTGAYSAGQCSISSYSGQNSVMEIANSDGVRVLMYHMDFTDANTAQPGAFVNAGDVVGKMGSVGCADGVHIHFEVKKGSQLYNSNQVAHAGASNLWAFANYSELEYADEGYTPPPPQSNVKRFPGVHSGDWLVLKPADVDGDGDEDLVAYNKITTAVNVTRSTGTNFGGGYQGSEIWNSYTAYGSNWTLLNPADVNGDGKADLIAYEQSTSQVDVTLSTGSNFGGGYMNFQVWNYYTAYGSTWILFDPVDVNGDGKADLVAYEPSTSKVDVTLSTGSNFGGGNGGFQVWNDYTAYGSTWDLLQPADVNGDGKADLIAYERSTSQVDVTLSTGTHFGSGHMDFQVWNYYTAYGSTWKLLDPADVNGDGKADLIAYEPSTSQVDVTLSTGSNFGGGNGGFQVWNDYTAYGTTWDVLPPSNVDGDLSGKADLVAFEKGTSKVDVTPSTGSNFGGGHWGFEVWNADTTYR
jgi:murein DD-endopeptidase MepM/ murein hydrolase activator NlpD